MYFFVYGLMFCFGNTNEKGDNNMCKILTEIGGLTAYELLEKYSISLSPPIDIKKLVDNIGIRLVRYDFSEAEKAGNYPQNSIIGAALSEKDSLNILYATKMTLNRIRFTIAHELAHCCLHNDNLEINHLELRTDDNSDRERDANIFAGELLIPYSSLMSIYNQLLKPSLSVLAQIFQVSTSVMKARLNYLELRFVDDSSDTLQEG